MLNRTERRMGQAIALIGLLFIARMTLRPSPDTVLLAEETPFLCLLCGALGLVDVILNVLLFIPYGIGLRLAGLSRLRTMGLVVLTTGAIELTQYLFLPGRDASLSDLLTNTTGGAIGLVLAERWRALLLPNARTARRLAAAAALVWLGAQGITAWALVPSFPVTRWWGQRVPELGQFDRYQGTLLAASLAGAPLPDGRLPDSRAVRESLRRGPAAITAVATTAGATRRVAPVASVFDENRSEVLVLGERGQDLYFRIRLRAADAALRTPGIRLPEGLAVPPGDTVAISGALDGRRLIAEVAHRGHIERVERVLGPSLGWSLLLPFENYALGPETRWLTAAWLAGLLFPLGYWLRLGRRAARGGVGTAVLLAAAVIAIGLGGMAWWGGFATPSAGEWVAAALGAAAGWVAAGPAQALVGRSPKARSASSP